MSATGLLNFVQSPSRIAYALARAHLGLELQASVRAFDWQIPNLDPKHEDFDS